MAHVPDPENEAQLAVTLAHHRVLGEHQGLRPLLRPGQLGEDRAHLQMGTSSQISGWLISCHHGLGSRQINALVSVRLMQ